MLRDVVNRHNYDRELPCDSEAPRVARDWSRIHIAHELTADRAAAVVDDAMLVISELVTNAVDAHCHTASLHLRFRDRELRVSVTDDADGIPNLAPPARTAKRGRGLPLVAALASSWGVETLVDGKEVWARIRLKQSLAL
jgi:anti-sigma regulatory factor (Ser/Thr protein kinase)